MPGGTPRFAGSFGIIFSVIWPENFTTKLFNGFLGAKVMLVLYAVHVRNSLIHLRYRQRCRSVHIHDKWPYIQRTLFYHSHPTKSNLINGCKKCWIFLRVPNYVLFFFMTHLLYLSSSFHVLPSPMSHLRVIWDKLIIISKDQRSHSMAQFTGKWGQI